MTWWDGWWMGGMMIAMVIFWGAVIFGIAWLVRTNAGQQPRRDEEALRILDRRFAEGAISADEYRQQKAVLIGEQAP